MRNQYSISSLDLTDQRRLYGIYSPAGYVRDGKMKDVLLAATHEAGAMIEENLNGISFANSRMALNNLVLTLQRKRDYLDSVKMEVTKIDEQRRQDVWQLLQREVTS